MILRLFELSAPFDCEGSTDYGDIECDAWQLTNGILQIMRFKAQDVFVPLSSIKMFKEVVIAPSKQLTDSDLADCEALSKDEATV